MRIRPHPLAAALALLAACSPADDGSRRGSDAQSGGTLAVHPTQRAMVRVVGSDTLSDSARVLRVLPEPDGTSIPFTFADPATRVSAALAITGGAADGTQLLWPDSVVSLWWSGPHQLTFATRTGAGARVVVDVHAAKLTIIEQRRVTPPPPADTAVPAEVRARAQSYVDSLH